MVSYVAIRTRLQAAYTFWLEENGEHLLVRKVGKLPICGYTDTDTDIY